MQELIKIETRTFGNGEIQTVSARELYLGLGLSASQWSRWSLENIERNEFFKQDIDFIQLDIMSSAQNPNPSKDYAISIDFAKHITMMARTEKAHDYRNYFLECERIAKEAKVPLTQGQLLVQMAIAYEAHERRLLEMEAQKQTVAEHSESIKAIEAKQKAIEMSSRHFAIMAYANLIGVSVDLTTASKLGKRCAARSRERNLPIGRVRNPRFGFVGTYVEEILEEVFAEFAEL